MSTKKVIVGERHALDRYGAESKPNVRVMLLVFDHLLLWDSQPHCGFWLSYTRTIPLIMLLDTEDLQSQKDRHWLVERPWIYRWSLGR